MYIEDLIQSACGPFFWQMQSPSSNVSMSPRDRDMLNSFYEQLYYRNSDLTEKQGKLAVSILKRNKDILRPHFPNIDLILDNPQWRNPFRVLSTVNKISIGVVDSQNLNYKNKKSIIIEFPYNLELVDVLRKRNQDVHDLYKGHWDPNHKKWLFSLTEKNILWLGKNLLPKSFDADDQFLEYFKQVTEVCEQVENHAPMLSIQDGKYQIVNASSRIPQPETDDLVQALFFARLYGIVNWDDAIGKEVDKLNPITRGVLAFNKKSYPWFNSEEIAIDNFVDLLQNASPALIVIPGGGELVELKKWHQFSKSLGIGSQEISVLFRLPNDRADFNKYVKDENLNNAVDENTKLVFVSTKIPKPLVKSDIKFDTVINLGYYNYVHFTMSTIINNATNLVYYSTKELSRDPRWRRQEL